MTARRWLGRLLNLLYPPKCPFCGALSPGGEVSLCPRCEQALPWAEGTFSAQGFDSGVFVLYYEGAVRESLLRYKFGGCSGYAGVYGPLLAQRIAEGLGGRFDLISYVPVSRWRRATRGYDQSELLARAVARCYGVLPVATLHKRRQNRTQSQLHSADARRANVSGVYMPVGPERFAGQRVLLIDDIVTTGATLSEAARTLRAAGAADVVCAALAGKR